MHGILIALVVLQGTPAVSRDAADLKELHRLETVWNEAHVKGDADALDELWADDLIVTVSAMRLLNKADALAMVRSNHLPFTHYQTSELDVKRFTDSALVTGRLTRERTLDGKPVIDNWRFTKVYVRSQGKWRVIAWRASPAAQ